MIRYGHRTEDLAVLKKGVTKHNMAREIPKFCDLTLQELFPIKQDILFEGNTFNINDAVRQSAHYKMFLIRW